jgi:hypothetical protein
MYGFEDIGHDQIDQSNQTFSYILSRYINETLNVLYKSLMTEYQAVTRINPIARFNFKQLQLMYNGRNRILGRKAGWRVLSS